MEHVYETNLYEDFMKNHLSHYGYYTGRNEMYRARANFTEWNSTYGYVLSESYKAKDDSVSSQEDKVNDGSERLRTTQLTFDYDADKMISRLREPRHLYTDTVNMLGPQQLPRWPAEVEVIDEPVTHIQCMHQQQEPFYIPHGLESTPDIKGTDGAGVVVFELKAKPGLFFQQSRVGGLSREGLSEAAVPLTGPEDTTLIFESRFESGNLERAIQVGPNDYELWMRNDLYTNKHTQWFYFRVSNTRKGISYRLTICNFTKSSSLYDEGMRPLSYSVTESARAGSSHAGWHRSGSNIKYYKTNLRYLAGKTERSFYALTFTTQFLHDHDTVFFAHCYPYTYSDLQAYLGDVQNDEEKMKLCKLKVLCRTMAGNIVYLVTISAPEDDSEESIQRKKAVIVTARVHPGETNSSWMMKGIMDYLLSNDSNAKLLRDRFVFKIVPMLNPDGVIVGNYRCSLSGRDLNRNYGSTLKDSYPTVWHTKQMIQRTLGERDVMLYCDMHGHSKKQNVFIYGCENRAASSRWLHERVFPTMLGHIARDHFSYEDCNFKVQRNKEGTGRVTVWNMGIVNSYTMEATFCGGTLGKMKNYHFSAVDFERVGRHFCDALLDFCDPEKYQKILTDVEIALKASIAAKLMQCMAGQMEARAHSRRVDLSAPEQLDINDLYSMYLEESNKGTLDEDEGSNSSDSDGLPVKLEYMQKLNSLKTRQKTKRKDKEKMQRSGRLATDTTSLPDGRRTAASNTINSKSQAVEEATIKIYRKQSHHKCRTKDNQSKRPSTKASGIATVTEGSAHRKSSSAADEMPKQEETPAVLEENKEAGNLAQMEAFYKTHRTARLNRRIKEQDISLRTMTNAYLTKGLLATQQPSTSKVLPHFKYSIGHHGAAHAVAASMVDLSKTASTALGGGSCLLQLRSDVLRESAYASHIASLGRQGCNAACGATYGNEEKNANRVGTRQSATFVSDDFTGRPITEGYIHGHPLALDSPYVIGKVLKQHPPPFDTSLDTYRHSGSVATFLDYRTAEDRMRLQATGLSRSGELQCIKKRSALKETAPSSSENSQPSEDSSCVNGGSRVRGRAGKYLDDMVKETDAAIQYLTDQIEGMQKKQQLSWSKDGRQPLKDEASPPVPASHERLLIKRCQSKLSQDRAANAWGLAKGKHTLL